MDSGHDNIGASPGGFQPTSNTGLGLGFKEEIIWPSKSHYPRPAAPEMGLTYWSAHSGWKDVGIAPMPSQMCGEPRYETATMLSMF